MATTLYCSFCGKRRDEVEMLLGSVGDAFICNECVETSLIVLGENGIPPFSRLVRANVMPFPERHRVHSRTSPT